MYLLYAVDYPARALRRSEVENAWSSAGLPQPVPSFPRPEVTAAEVSTVVRDLLRGRGAIATDGAGDLEVPDEAGELLERLEAFHGQVWPEMRTAASRHAFTYEKVGMLGEF